MRLLVGARLAELLEVIFGTDHQNAGSLVECGSFAVLPMAVPSGTVIQTAVKFGRAYLRFVLYGM